MSASVNLVDFLVALVMVFCLGWVWVWEGENKGCVWEKAGVSEENKGGRGPGKKKGWGRARGAFSCRGGARPTPPLPARDSIPLPARPLAVEACHGARVAPALGWVGGMGAGGRGARKRGEGREARGQAGRAPAFWARVLGSLLLLSHPASSLPPLHPHARVGGRPRRVVEERSLGVRRGGSGGGKGEREKKGDTHRGEKSGL